MKRLSCNYNVIEVIETNACVYTKLSPVCTFFFYVYYESIMYYRQMIFQKPLKTWKISKLWEPWYFFYIFHAFPLQLLYDLYLLLLFTSSPRLFSLIRHDVSLALALCVGLTRGLLVNVTAYVNISAKTIIQ